MLIRETLSHVAPKRTAWSEEMRQLTTRDGDLVVELITAGQADGSLLNNLVADRS